MESSFDINTIMTSVASTLTGDIQDAATVALPVAAGVLAIGVVWRVFRKLVRG